ncbi:MAG: DoxX family protein [Bacteroidetes bacterium]|nr:DoxX family protein [Bacteroidota bacterium]
MMALIKKLFKTGNYPENISISLLFLRIIAGVFMLTHCYGKFLMLFGDGPVKFADPLGIGVTVSLALTVLAEFLCSIFLIFGLATRFSAVPLLITMLVAAFVVLAPDAFARKELALLYAAIYAVIAIAGPGKYSADNWIFKRLK